MKGVKVAKKKRTRKTKAKKTKNISFNLNLEKKHVFGIVLALILIAGICWGINYFLHNSSLFSIKEVLVNGKDIFSQDIYEPSMKKYYLGRNIFTVSITHIEKQLVRDLPYLKKVEVRRSLPDTLSIYVTERVPIALIDHGSGVVIDGDAVVLGGRVPRRNLIKIQGVSFFLGPPRPGETVNSRLIDKALRIIKLLAEQGISANHNAEYIDVSNRDSIFIKIDGVLVKLGKADFLKNIKRLAVILRDESVDMKGIEYIDLRFEDVVIAPK